MLEQFSSSLTTERSQRAESALGVASEIGQWSTLRPICGAERSEGKQTLPLSSGEDRTMGHGAPLENGRFREEVALENERREMLALGVLVIDSQMLFSFRACANGF